MMLNKNNHLKTYTTFDEKSYEKLLAVIRNMKAYSLDYSQSAKMTDYFYDNAGQLLTNSGIVLRRRVMGKKAYLNIMRLHYDEQFFYMDHLRSHERELEIASSDPLSKHYFFLNNALNSMFTNALQFDTDKLFEQMNVILTMEVAREVRTILGFGGLKVELRCDKTKFLNKLTNRKNAIDIVRFRLLSGEETLPFYEDFIKKVEKYCKEIFRTQENRLEIALRMTKPLPTKEERVARKVELEKLKRLEKTGLTAIKK